MLNTKKHTMAVAVILLAILGVLRLTAGVELVRDGQSGRTIVIAEDATSVERYAAAELQKYLEAATGCRLPVTVPAQAGGDWIVVGAPNAVRQLVPALALPEKLRPDEVRCVVEDGTLVLTGAAPRGVLYAVYEFLERELGVRFFTPECEKIPQHATIELADDFAIRYAPVFRGREVLYRSVLSAPAFAAKMRDNGHFPALGGQFGGHNPILGWCHTFGQIMPGEELQATHPEWLALVNGKRDPGGLCLANPAMREEFLKRVRQSLRQAPDTVLISISQNDNDSYCRCDECRTLDEAEGTPAASLIRFVNSIAAELEPEYPELTVETLAYLYSRKAPRSLAPRANVIVRLCTMEEDFSRPLADPVPGSYGGFATNLEEWSAIAPQLMIWNYVANFRNYLIPHPNWRHLGADLRYLAAHRVVNVLEQGDAGSADLGDFVELRTWLLSQLLWNPEQDQSALMREFLTGYYGEEAGMELYQAIELLTEEIEKSGVPLHCFNRNHVNDWLSAATLQAAWQCFDRALAAAAGDPVRLERVRRARLPLDLVRMWNYRFGGGGAAEQAEMEELLEDFKAMVAASAPLGWHETEAVPPLLERLENNIRGTGIVGAAPIPEVCRNLPRQSWHEFLGNDFTIFDTSCAGKKSDLHGVNGSVLRLLASPNGNWGAQYPLPEKLQGKRFRVLAALRRAPEATGTVTVGVYAPATGQQLRRELRADEIPVDGYRFFPVAELYSMTSGDYLYVASAPDTGEIYLDRVILIEERL